MFETYNKNKKIIGTVLLLIGIILISIAVIIRINPSFLSSFESDEQELYCCPEIEFRKEHNTLIVENITPFPDKSGCIDCELTWDKWEVRQYIKQDIGYNWSTQTGVILPNGTIDIGDVVTNCSGAFAIVYKPCLCCVVFDTPFSVDWDYWE